MVDPGYPLSSEELGPQGLVELSRRNQVATETPTVDQVSVS